MKRPNILAFYLPQYYPFKENNEWWGEGFTEWTSVGRAKPLFKGHYQPKVPADLSYYDLRLPIVREQQANLAKQYGVDGFCYWHYWFGNGKRLLDLVENEILRLGKPDFPFCFCWANHTWYAKNWNSKDSKIGYVTLIEQKYLGKDDYVAHFNYCLPFFKDKRYIKIDGKPFFGVYDATAIPDITLFFNIWNELAKKNGFEGIYFVCYCSSVDIYEQVKTMDFDEFTVDPMSSSYKKDNGLSLLWRRFWSHFKMDNLITLRRIDYNDYSKIVIDYFKQNNDVSICVVPNYDHSPRSGKNALVLTNSNPKNFGLLLDKIHLLYTNRDNKFLFIKAWNEWGEGNYLEPDLKYKKGFLEQIKKVFGSNK